MRGSWAVDEERVSSKRSRIPSFSRSRAQWFSTVFGLMNSTSAMSLSTSASWGCERVVGDVLAGARAGEVVLDQGRGGIGVQERLASHRGAARFDQVAVHWGYVISGKVTFQSANGEETFETGDAYYVPPGHTPRLYANTEVIEFSPTDELQHTLEVVTKNMEAAGA